MHNEPVQDLSFPLPVIRLRDLGESESAKNPAEKHAHLQHCQILPDTVCRSVREREERSCVMLSIRRTSAEPSFGKKHLG